MAKPDKTDLLNAFVARSLEAWAKATVDLYRQRKRESLASASLSADNPIIDGPATSLELLKSS